MSMRLRPILIAFALIILSFGMASAKATGTIKTYDGMTYFEVKYVIYDAIQEVHFHDFAGRLIKIQFNDILWMTDEHGNDITYLIRPDFIKPNHLLSKANANMRIGERLSDVLIVWLIFGISYNAPLGDIMEGTRYYDSTLSDPKSGTSPYIGFLFYLKSNIELQMSIITRSLKFENDWEQLNPKATNYDISIRIHPKSDYRIKSKTDYYFQTGVGLMAHVYGFEDEKLVHFLTVHAGGGFIYQVSDKVGFDFNLRVNSINKFEDPFGSLEGVQLTSHFGIIFQL